MRWRCSTRPWISKTAGRRSHVLLGKAAVALGEPWPGDASLGSPPGSGAMHPKKQRNLAAPAPGQMYVYRFTRNGLRMPALDGQTLKLAEKVGTPAHQLEARWLAGRALAGLGKLDEAVKLSKWSAIRIWQTGTLSNAQRGARPRGGADRQRRARAGRGSRRGPGALNVTDSSRSTLKLFCKLARRALNQKSKELRGDSQSDSPFDAALRRPV